MSEQKRLNKAAIKFVDSTTVDWGTEIDVGVAGAGITPLNPGVPQAVLPVAEVDEIYGPGETDIELPLTNPTDFSLDFNYQWDGLENMLLAAVMGTAGAPTRQVSVTGTSYRHSLVMADSVTGKYFTYAVEKGAKVHVVPSVKAMKATFSNAEGMIRLSFNLRGTEVIDDSSTVTDLDDVTYPSINTRAKFHQAVFRMNDRTGAALDVDDKICPKNFTLEIERRVDSEHTSCYQHIIEPVENNKYQVKLTMEFPRMDATNAAYFAEWKAKTEKKLDLVITGPVIETVSEVPYPYYIKFEMPRLAIESVEYADAGIIPAKIVMRGLTAASAPTGMTGLVKPVTITVVNTRSTDLLATT